MSDLRDALVEAVAEAERSGQAWAAETMREAMAIADRREARRAAVITALRTELRTGCESFDQTPDRTAYIADRLTGYLAPFVMSLDDRTWTPAAEPNRRADADDE